MIIGVNVYKWQWILYLSNTFVLSIFNFNMLCLKNSLLSNSVKLLNEYDLF
jgi:hypothetical protein